MKKSYKPIPYEIFLSELYKNLVEYYHSEHKKQPVFRLTYENINYLIKFIESSSNNKISIDRDTSRLENYNIYPGYTQLTLYKPLVSESLYPPYFHPLWKKFIKEGIMEYLFENESCIVSYFDKEEMKELRKTSNPKADKTEMPEMETNEKTNIILKIIKKFKKN